MMPSSVSIAVVFCIAVLTTTAEPIPRAGKSGPPMLLGTSVMTDEQNAVVKSIGFSHSQTDSDHLTVNETAPGVWDWSQADAGLAAMKKAGMQWQYFPHFHWAPDWYRKTDKFVPSIGLRTKRELSAISLWSPDIVPWFDRCYGALAKHYGSGTSNIYAIYLGVHGDFGETIFPMGWHPDEQKRFGESGKPVPDFWCGDNYARTNFQVFARSKYKSVSKLNAAWGTKFKNFSEAGYPPTAFDKNVSVTDTAQSRRYWLDFIDWYYDSMTRFTGEVCRIARKHFPDALLELPVGGGSEDLMYGQDTTGIPKIAKRYNVHIRSTHGGFQPFAQNYAGMLKKIATACKIYDVPHWLEPPGGITPDGEVSRIMEAISCGNFGFWDWGANPLPAADKFREYTNYFTREQPVVDVALFFPTTDHRLHPETTFPRELQSVGASLRDVMDFDMIDEPLIADGALSRYRVLVWVEGKYVEAQTLEKIQSWIRKGGVLVWNGTNIIQTVEGDTKAGCNLLGLSEKTTWHSGGKLTSIKPSILPHLSKVQDAQAIATASNLNRHATVVASAAGNPAVWRMRNGVIASALDANTWKELVRDTVYDLSKLDKTKHDALEIDHGYDGVYITLLKNGETILHNSTDQTRTNEVGNMTVVLPPHSLRSVLLKRNSN